MRILHWPIYELMNAVMYRMREDARRTHRQRQLVWAILNADKKKKTQQPKLPRILEDGSGSE